MNCEINYDTDGSSSRSISSKRSLRSRRRAKNQWNQMVRTCPNPSSVHCTPSFPCRATDCPHCLDNWNEACQQGYKEGTVAGHASAGRTKLAEASIVNPFANPCTPMNVPDVHIQQNQHHHQHHYQQHSGMRTPERNAHPVTDSSTPTTSSSSSSSSSSSGSSIGSNSEPTRFAENKSTRRSRKDTFEEHQKNLADDDVVRALSPPPASCDLVILVGNQKFYHSSAILAYASDYLKGKMVSNVQHGQYYVIDFSTHSPEEWKLVLEFLQPRSLGTAHLSWQSLPVILPWFAEFKLQVLLKDIDVFLLETIVASQRDDDEGIDLGKCITLPNLLLLTNIAYACGLETVRSQCRQWLHEKLIKPQQLPQEAHGDYLDEQDVELDWSLNDLQSLSRLLTEFEDLRDYLWEKSLIMYLPHDLNVADSLGLVDNPLFAYLLREGMMQLCVVQRAQFVIQQQQHRDLNDIAGDNEDDSGIFLTYTTSSCTTIPTNPATAHRERLTQGMLHVLLQSTVEHIEKFQKERERGSSSSAYMKKQKRRSRKQKSTKQVEVVPTVETNFHRIVSQENVRETAIRSRNTMLVAEVEDRTTNSSVVATMGPKHRTFEC